MDNTTLPPEPNAPLSAKYDDRMGTQSGGSLTFRRPGGPRHIRIFSGILIRYGRSRDLPQLSVLLPGPIVETPLSR